MVNKTKNPNFSFAISRVFLGDLNAFVKNLMKATGIKDANELVHAVNAGELELKPIAKAVATSILIMVGTVTIAPTSEAFVAKDKFVIIKETILHATSKVKISYINENFKSWLLEKVEQPFAGSELCYQKFTKNSPDAPIIAELGGETKAETTLTEMFSLMEKQPCGENWTLLTNGYANIFYIRDVDVNGVLRAVDVHWDDDGWSVNAYDIGLPSAWRAGRQVFSRNSITV